MQGFEKLYLIFVDFVLYRICTDMVKIFCICVLGGAISKQSTAIVIIAILVVFVLAVVIALFVYLHRKSIASYIVK